MIEWMWLLPLFFWIVMLLLPWQPWRVRETLQAVKPDNNTDLSDICVVIPARNEAGQIAQTLQALAQQGDHLQVIVVDDQSRDATAETARRFQGLDITVLEGKALPDGWTGKLWALQQGYATVKRPITVLLDADITLVPGVLASLREKMQHDNLSFVSVMARLSMSSFWEKLLLPAFVYFFKQLYPFALSNNPRVKFVAAAAGGCIMIKSDALKAIGGFSAIRDSLIDDCALARKVKQHGYGTWIGLTLDVISHRPYGGLKPIWEMVSRTAFHQLKYSIAILLVMTLIFVTIYGLPWAGLLAADFTIRLISALAVIIMMGMYLPTLRYYGLKPLWSLGMPLIALLYLAMTWYSAIEYWSGVGNGWRGRQYKHRKVTASEENAGVGKILG